MHTFSKEYFKLCLTPSYSAELEDVGRNIDVEDLDQGEVHVYGLQAHPGERSQQEVVQHCSSGNAQTVVEEG